MNKYKRDNHPRCLHIKFETILSCGSGEEVNKVLAYLILNHSAVLGKNLKISLLTKNDLKYSPKIQNFRLLLLLFISSVT